MIKRSSAGAIEAIVTIAIVAGVYLKNKIDKILDKDKDNGNTKS